MEIQEAGEPFQGNVNIIMDLIHVGIEKQLVKTPDTEVAVVDLTLQIVVEVTVVDLTLQIVVSIAPVQDKTRIFLNGPTRMFPRPPNLVEVLIHLASSAVIWINRGMSYI